MARDVLILVFKIFICSMTDINIQLFHYIYTINTYSLPSGHVQLWALDCKEGRMPKNWYLQTVVLEKTPESPLDSKETKPVNLREINPEYSLEGLMLKLKLQYYGHLRWIDNSFKKSQMLGKLEGRGEEGVRGWDGWMASLKQ